MIGPGRRKVAESIQPCVDCEVVTNYSPIFLANFKNISLIYAITVIKHDFSIHKRLPGPPGEFKNLKPRGYKTFFMLNSTEH